MQKKTCKQYNAHFKAKAVKEMLREEKTVGQLAAEYAVHSNMLYRWRDYACYGYGMKLWKRKKLQTS